MAKLNVSTSEIIEVDGVQYRRVEREVREGDIVQANENMLDVTYGGFYAVDNVGGGRFRFTDDAGDRRNRSVTDSDFVVYEKVEAKLEPESDELFTYEGVQYRKVKRKAEVGERVLIVNAGTTLGKYKSGDVHLITGKFLDHPTFSVLGGRIYVSHTEYVVLEPVKSAEPSKPTIKVGDTVKLTIADGKMPRYSWGSVKNGEIGTVKSIKSDTLTKVDFPSQSDWIAAPGELTVLSEAEAKAEAERAKWAAIGREVGEYKVGDVVEVIGEGSAGLAIGHIDVVCEVDSYGDVYFNTPNINGMPQSFYLTRNIKLITPVEQRFDRTEAVGVSS